jgi:hypothetical protein
MKYEIMYLSLQFWAHLQFFVYCLFAQSSAADKKIMLNKKSIPISLFNIYIDYEKN